MGGRRGTATLSAAASTFVPCLAGESQPHARPWRRSFAAPAAAQAVTPNPFYGVVGTFLPAPSDLSRIANAGGGTFRAQIDWKFTEPRPGVRDLYGTDILFSEKPLWPG